MSKQVNVKAYPKDFKEQVVKPGGSWIKAAARTGCAARTRTNWHGCGARFGSCAWSGRSCQKQRPGSLGRPTRFRPDLRVRKSASGPISDCVHVPGAGGLHQRVLRVAPAAEEPPGARECNPVGSHRGDSRAVTGDLRVTAGARGTAGARRGNFVAAGGAADARQRAEVADSPPRPGAAFPGPEQQHPPLPSLLQTLLQNRRPLPCGLSAPILFLR